MPTLLAYPHIAESHLLQSLCGAREDMKFVLDICQRLEASLAVKYRDLVLWEALSAAAIVHYVRCFQKGVRHKLEVSKLEAHDPAMFERHQYFYLLRDKHIAHSVSKFEENRLVATVKTDARTVVDVQSVHVECSKMIGFSEVDLPVMRELCSFWIDRISAEIGEQEKLVIVALKRLSRKQWDGMFQLNHPAAYEPDAHKTRRLSP